jgi:hypothetical protein
VDYNHFQAVIELYQARSDFCLVQGFRIGILRARSKTNVHRVDEIGLHYRVESANDPVNFTRGCLTKRFS